MMKDKVKDQKVFVPMSGVLELQKEFLRLHKLMDEQGLAGSRALTAERIRAIDYTIKTLGLPIYK